MQTTQQRLHTHLAKLELQLKWAYHALLYSTNTSPGLYAWQLAKAEHIRQKIAGTKVAIQLAKIPVMELQNIIGFACDKDENNNTVIHFNQPVQH